MVVKLGDIEMLPSQYDDSWPADLLGNFKEDRLLLVSAAARESGVRIEFKEAYTRFGVSLAGHRGVWVLAESQPRSKFWEAFDKLSHPESSLVSTPVVRTSDVDTIVHHLGWDHDYRWFMALLFHGLSASNIRVEMQEDPEGGASRMLFCVVSSLSREDFRSRQLMMLRVLRAINIPMYMMSVVSSVTSNEGASDGD